MDEEQNKNYDEQNQTTHSDTIPYHPSELSQDYEQEAIDLILKALTCKRLAIASFIISLIVATALTVQSASFTERCRQTDDCFGEGLFLFIIGIPCAIFAFAGFISTIISICFYFSNRKDFKRKFQKEWPKKADIKKIVLQNNMKKSSNASIIALWTLGALCGTVGIVLLFVFIFMGVYDTIPFVTAIALVFISILLFVVGNKKDKGK